MTLVEAPPAGALLPAVISMTTDDDTPDTSAPAPLPPTGEDAPDRPFPTSGDEAIMPEAPIGDTPDAAIVDAGTHAIQAPPPGQTWWRAHLRIIILACAAGFLVKLLLVEAFGIPSESMQNTLMVGDFLLVNKAVFGIESPRTLPLTTIPIPHVTLLPGYDAPDRGDVIVFEMPHMPRDGGHAEYRCYVKRLVGLPGDTVEIAGKRLLVNGMLQTTPPNALHESYTQRPGEVEPDIFPKGLPYNKDWWGPATVPYKGMRIDLTVASLDQWRQFIEGEDHTIRFATDGRIEIDGRAVEQYTVERNYFFFMGDNRDNSIDSRYWGYVPEEHIIGRPILIYWSWDSSIPLTSPIALIGSIRWDRIFSLVH